MLEIIERSIYTEGEGIFWNVVKMRITNAGTGPSNVTVLSGSPSAFVTCGSNTQPIAGEGGRCSLRTPSGIAPGASVEATLLFEASSEYAFTVEVSSDGQEDADPSNNLVSGQIDLTTRTDDDCSCASSAPRPLSVLPLALSLGFVLRRRRRC